MVVCTGSPVQLQQASYEESATYQGHETSAEHATHLPIYHKLIHTQKRLSLPSYALSPKCNEVQHGSSGAAVISPFHTFRF